MKKVLRDIKTKRSVNKEDLQKMLKLSKYVLLLFESGCRKDQMVVINKISKTRQKLLMKYLEEVPYLEDHFSIMIHHLSSYLLCIDFPLSRRESTISQNNNPSLSAAQLEPSELHESPVLQPAKRAEQLNWMNEVRERHATFSLDNASLEMLDKTQPPKGVFGAEEDLVLQMVKRIMYAEGDMLTLREECAEYLKDCMPVL